MSLSRREIPVAIPSIALVCFIVSPENKAVTPAPDGAYPTENTAEGQDALFSLTSGTDNVAIGFQALYYNTTGSFNTGIGGVALYGATSGGANTAIGYAALYSNGGGSENTALGQAALHENTAGNHNTATGSAALFDNGSDNNTATGYTALFHNGSGSNNTATGAYALESSTTASTNTATGFESLYNNTTGPVNTATGAYALHSNTTGQSNVATGVDALYHNQIGHDNTGEGYLALLNTTGSSNTALGSNAGANLTTGGNNIDLGAGVVGKASEANTIRLGKQGTQKTTFIAGIFNIAEPVASGIKPVYINSNGQLGTAAPSSSARFKVGIKPMNKTSEAILALKPVTFRYKSDEEQTPQFGLVAEEVAKVDPDLVVHDENGQIYTVRYDAVNAMLLNEFLKARRQITEQQEQIEKLTAAVEKVTHKSSVNTRRTTPQSRAASLFTSTK